MPELPEVESIRLKLLKYLIGHKIKKIELRFSGRFFGDKEKLIGGMIIDIRRFGKAQSIDLANGYSILVHVKMTGQLLYEGPNCVQIPFSKKVLGGVSGKHTHVVFYLDRGGRLYFNDVRKFGWIKVIETQEVKNDVFVKNLGPDAVNDLTFEYFQKIITKSLRPIKITIMDQSKISGVGNIYANDALWLAKINPKKACKDLNIKDKKKLFNAIKLVLKEGIKYGGSSETSFVTPDGQEGSYQNHTLVYGHRGEKCKRCKKGKIIKYFVSGRGTFACDICQNN